MCLGEGDQFVLQAAARFHQERLRVAFAHFRRDGPQLGQTDGALLPGREIQIKAYYRQLGYLGRIFFGVQAELHRVEPAVARLPPPGDFGRLGRHRQLHFAADVDEAETHRALLRRQVALQDGGAFAGLITERSEERGRIGIGLHKARRPAPAIEPEEEGIARRAGARLERLGPLLAQIRLGPPEELAADSLPSIVGMHDQGADYAGVIRESRLLRVRTEAGMHKADQFGVVEGEDDALAIEIGLGEVERLERIDADAGRGASTERHTVPEGGYSCRVAIGKRPILDHSTPGQSGTWPAGCSAAISFSAARNSYKWIGERLATADA